MCRSSLCSTLLIFTCLCAGVAPASAAHWVQTRDPWLWIDADSFVVDDGVTYYAATHSDDKGVAPSTETPLDLDGAFKCATGEEFSRWPVNNADGSPTVPPQYKWRQIDASPSNKEFMEARRHIVCDPPD